MPPKAIRGTAVGRPAQKGGYASQIYNEVTSQENRTVVTSVAFFVVCTTDARSKIGEPNHGQGLDVWQNGLANADYRLASRFCTAAGVRYYFHRKSSPLASRARKEWHSNMDDRL